MRYTHVVSSHMNPSLSGVAKFNAMLARRLGIPCVSVEEAAAAGAGPLLVSVKLGDNDHAELEGARATARKLAGGKTLYDLFFHTFDGLDAEYALVEGCRRIFCGNQEIAHALEGVDKDVSAVWCPPLVNAQATIHETRLNLFSFGMAHKLQLRHYRRLREVLDGFKSEHALWVSTAFHEKANFGDFDAVSRQMSEVFRDGIQFLGFLSDDAVNYFLDKAQVFVSFFAKGVRANNTSVSAAMARGCVVLTNLDEQSPAWMRHGENVLDIHKLSPDDLGEARRAAIGAAARRDAQRWSSWESLTALISSKEKRGGPPVRERPAPTRGASSGERSETENHV